MTDHIEADRFTYEPKAGRGAYTVLNVRAGNRGTRRVVPPAGEDYAYDRQEWARRVQVNVSPTGRSVRVFVDGREVPQDLDRLHAELEWVRSQLVDANADTIDALRARLLAGSPA
jgi:hypothetical protein